MMETGRIGSTTKARLLVCPACVRHVRVDEKKCPFCACTLPDAFGQGPAPTPPPSGLTRVELYRYGASRAALTAAIALVGAASVGELNCTAYGISIGTIDF